MTLPLSPQVFMILSRAIEDRLGLHYTAEDADLLAAKISPRAEERGFESLLDYYYFIRYDADGSRELEDLADALVVNETYFFREYEQLRAAVETIVAPRVSSAGSARVWCAACATGDEPASLAMMLSNRGLLGRCQIVAPDVHRRSLERAKSGVYRGRSLRALPHPEMRKHLRLEGNEARVSQGINTAIDWLQLNLIDSHAISALGQFDLILCRNVLIYFSDETTQKVITGLTSALRGYLAVGVSESLMRLGTSLQCEERAGYFFYKAAAS